MHGRFCIPPLPPLLLQGRTRSSYTIPAPSLFFPLGPGRRRIRLPSAFTNTFLLVPGFHATCLASKPLSIN